ncbi:transposon Ty3-I Gag-Pol polyprotein [Trichonephila clavipes]|uniref:Transposon Ty3-I Gag-Pol polyprotein n=1 Tax=Trichonephila clavipes TaxID=2585209 RepID=A0A8X6V8Z9_TRICX|nr:transposon Ty3-I Gag-Pol polyprotein [Trichonephila clavipes]
MATGSYLTQNHSRSQSEIQGDLHTVTTARCRNALEHYVYPFMGAVGPDFILMHDNVMPRRAHLVDEFLKSEDIRETGWPTRSPELKPYKSCLGYSRSAILTLNLPPRTIQGQKTVFLNKWFQLKNELSLTPLFSV